MTVLRTATPAQLEQAIAANHRVFFRMQALMAGGEERQTGGIVWTRVGGEAGSNIAFPSLPPAGAGPLLDQLMEAYQETPPRQAGCWSLDPPQPADLGLLLLARGFQPGWRPHWMALDLERDLPDGYAVPSGLRIVADQTTAAVGDLPYAGSNVLMQSGASENALTQRFVARLNDEVVGHSGVLCTRGPLGVAGMYNVGVRPRYQGQGIGKALVLATCRYAREAGWRYAVLNASNDGKRIYTQLGFQSLGDGWTWWLMADRWLGPPTRAQVALAEAIGRGDVAGLDPFPEDLNKPMANGMTLMELAIHLQQPASVSWLMSRGVPLRPLDAWDLGWRDRASTLLSEQPSLVNEVHGVGKLTLLHTAIERDDIDLLRLALASNPDLSIVDKAYQGTALGWAYHFGRQEMVRLIEAQSAS